jgi:hypothetical protein
MSDIGVVSIAKRAATAIARGEIDQNAFAKLQQRLAQEQFPSDSVGVALQKFYSTPHGAEMLYAGLKASHEARQLATALSASVPLGKMGGGAGHERAANPASRQSEYETPPAPRVDDTPRGTGDSSRYAPPGWDGSSAAVSQSAFDKAVELLMRDKNISRDAAITEIYRAEKRRKGLSY